ncbi:MAG: GNAT family N-acetyltransferase [Nanoarchaeota archaeon]|nr:GNAT family N-acetyltransferase [Nanoarchaeota archaeon]MBU1444942.1 GNAT family N-acetyltransferase [Nanoarchaeota archaeon]MBU2420292.1 GNAT family N-acetyltransferase [Nanoarchaeota archaeon]MBU2475696.1 GNAT family N-acetyltransferase [Nanoarchaeota archaeon]
MKLTFKKIEKEDLKFLNEIREKKLDEIHLGRIKKQNKDQANYIMAFFKKEPVSHVFIDYKSKYSWHKFPAIEDLYVKKSKRNKGIAQETMNYAEKQIKQKGFKEACLDVETHEHWIKKFYEKLGYSKVSGPHNLRYKLGDKEITEIVFHLKKKL